jgi:hypothetical protein
MIFQALLHILRIYFRNLTQTVFETFIQMVKTSFQISGNQGCEDGILLNLGWVSRGNLLGSDFSLFFKKFHLAHESV